MAATDDPRQVEDFEAEVGHPGDRWDVLKERIQGEAITTFNAVQDDWLELVWMLDCYRVASIVPRGMGNLRHEPAARLAAIYRSKGNWYAELLALLLGNRTAQKLAPRSRVEGFSQLHQIDVAWPDRDTKPLRNPLVCLETKVTGAPAYGSTRARGALSDWSNRRKELKFAATDLKLWRRASDTVIDHWDEWRFSEEPACYFLWGARMTPRDSAARMLREVQALTKTYLDGAGVFAWREASDSGYEPVNLVQDQSDRVSTVDDMLRRIASRIAKQAPRGEVPPLEVPESMPVQPMLLGEDTKSQSD